MTREEFDSTLWHAGMTVEYKGWKYYVGSVNFIEALIVLDDGNSESAEDGMWVRCESVEVIK